MHLTSVGEVGTLLRNIDQIIRFTKMGQRVGHRGLSDTSHLVCTLNLAPEKTSVLDTNFLGLHLDLDKFFVYLLIAIDYSVWVVNNK